MNVWYNAIERDAWIEKNCRTCFQVDEARKRVTGDGPGCPHLLRAEQNKLPTPWKKRRNAVMGETYTCADYLKQPPVNRRGVAPADTPSMLDVPEAERNLVPVEGWPDWAAEARRQKGGDHA